MFVISFYNHDYDLSVISTYTQWSLSLETKIFNETLSLEDYSLVKVEHLESGKTWELDLSCKENNL